MVNSGGFANATTISGGTLEVASGGSAVTVLFGNSGTLQLDSPVAFVGTISGFQLGDGIDLRGLTFSAASSTSAWTQITTGPNASGSLTVTEGASSVTLTLVGTYTSGNFVVTSDGSGGTLITDPPVTGGAGGSTFADIAPASAASLISGGFELGVSGGTASDTDSGGGADRGAFFSGGGMVQLDSLLSQFAGDISGFDLVDEVNLQSLGLIRHPAPYPGCNRPPPPTAVVRRASTAEGTFSALPCSGSMRPN